jgi:hypothetical protein
MSPLDSNAYLFTPDLAANIIHAEARKFHAEAPIHGWTDTELQDLARKLSWILAKDINPADLDIIIMYTAELSTITAGIHENLDVNPSGTINNRDALRDNVTRLMFEEITFMVAGVRTRWELAA